VVCEPRSVAVAELSAVVVALRNDPGVIGAAVLRPHTVAIARLLDGLGPEAEAVRAVNAISHRAGGLIGWNTDRPAFSIALEDAGYQPRGRSALVLGAGGAARAAADAIRTLASRVYIAAPDLEQARSLCRDLDISRGGPTPLGSLSLVVPKVNLIINATPVGTDNGLCTATATTSLPAPPSPNYTQTVTGVLTCTNGIPPAGAIMHAVWHEKAADKTCDATADATGTASCNRQIGSLTPGYKVVIDVTFGLNGASYPTTTGFTPQ